VIGRIVTMCAMGAALAGASVPGHAQGHRLDYVPGQETQDPGRKEQGSAARQQGAAEITPDQSMQETGKAPSAAGRTAPPPSRPATSGQSSGRNKDEAPKPQAR
jgi:hypothetical protein